MRCLNPKGKRVTQWHQTHQLPPSGATEPSLVRNELPRILLVNRRSTSSIVRFGANSGGGDEDALGVPVVPVAIRCCWCWKDGDCDPRDGDGGGGGVEEELACLAVGRKSY